MIIIEIPDMEDQLALQSDDDAIKKILISTNKYVFLSIITFGLYDLWWIYKAWNVIKTGESLPFSSAVRTIFSIIFLYSLFKKIDLLARSKGYDKSYSAGGMFFGFFVVSSLSYLPDPFWLISFLRFIFIIPPFEALNSAIRMSGGYDVEFQIGFNNRQAILIVVGSVLWLLVILGLLTDI